MLLVSGRQSEGEDKYHAKQAKEKANNAGEEPDVDGKI